jgi:hypothetical protein
VSYPYKQIVHSRTGDTARFYIAVAMLPRPPVCYIVAYYTFVRQVCFVSDDHDLGRGHALSDLLFPEQHIFPALPVGDVKNKQHHSSATIKAVADDLKAPLTGQIPQDQSNRLFAYFYFASGEICPNRHTVGAVESAGYVAMYQAGFAHSSVASDNDLECSHLDTCIS